VPSSACSSVKSLKPKLSSASSAFSGGSGHVVAEAEAAVVERGLVDDDVPRRAGAGFGFVPAARWPAGCCSWWWVVVGVLPAGAAGAARTPMIAPRPRRVARGAPPAVEREVLDPNRVAEERDVAHLNVDSLEREDRGQVRRRVLGPQRHVLQRDAAVHQPQVDVADGEPPASAAVACFSICERRIERQRDAEPDHQDHEHERDDDPASAVPRAGRDRIRVGGRRHHASYSPSGSERQTLAPADRVQSSSRSTAASSRARR